MPRRVLILSASSGAGHVRAARAPERAFAARSDCQVERIDTLDYTSKLFQKIYEDAYIALVRRAPGLMGLLYDRFDRPWSHPSRRLALDRLNTGPMIRLLKRPQRMRAAVRAMARPYAAAEIAADSLRLLEGL